MPKIVWETLLILNWADFRDIFWPQKQLSISDILKWVISPPLDRLMFPPAWWHAGVNGCVCICVAGLPSPLRRSSQTSQRTDSSPKWCHGCSSLRQHSNIPELMTLTGQLYCRWVEGSWGKGPDPWVSSDCFMQSANKMPGSVLTRSMC